MLFLLFRLGNDRYALDVADIAKVLSLDALREAKSIPGAPVWVAGVFGWHGATVPIIDLSARALGHPAARRLSTRVVLIHYPRPGADARLLALIVEQATRTARLADEDFAAAGIESPAAPYLGPVAPDPLAAGKLLQRITIAQLIPDEVKALLFNTEVPA